MKPVKFPESNVDLAKDQPEYQPLPVMWDDCTGTVTSCWRLSWKERWVILRRGLLYFQMMNFGKPPMPIYPTVIRDEVIGKHGRG